MRNVLFRNWVKIAEAHVELPEYGLVMVTGSNAVSEGKFQSVGSGKTAWGEGLAQVLFGVPGRFTHFKDASRDNQGDTYLRVEAMFLGKPLIVEAGYKCKEMSKIGEALRYSYDGREVERGRIEQTREDLSQLLGVTTRLAQWTVYLDGEHLKFDHMNQGDSVSLVMDALRQPPWNEYHEQSKKTVSELKKESATSQGLLAKAKDFITTCQERVCAAQSDLDNTVAAYEQAKSRIENACAQKTQRIAELELENTELETLVEALTKEMNQLVEDTATTHKELEVQYKDTQDQLQQLRLRSQEVSRAYHRRGAELTQAEKEYDTLLNVPEICPTCQRPWEGHAPDTQHIQECFQKLEQAKERHVEATEAKRVLDEEIQTVETLLADLAQQRADLGVQATVQQLGADHAQHLQKIQENTRAVRTLHADCERLRGQLNNKDLDQKTATLEERQRLATLAETELESASANASQALLALNVANYWNVAFSPVGIPNMILQDSIGPLNHEAKRISAAMTGGTLGIQFSTKKALADGQPKPQLLIATQNKIGSTKLQHHSKGEAGLANFIVAETLAAVGQVTQRVGFRWYDEVLPNHDAVVCQSLYAYMREIAHTKGIVIFVVTHDPSAANYADYFLHVEKQKVGSEYVSTVSWR